MRILLIVALTYFAFVLKTTFPLIPNWERFGPQTELVLLALLLPRCGGAAGLLIAALWGLLADGLAQAPPGINTIGFVLAGYALQFVGAGRAGSTVARGLVVGVAGFALSIGELAIREVVFDPSTWGAELPRSAGPAIATAVAAWLLMALANAFQSDGRTLDRSSTPTVSNRWRMLTE